jgi:predicted transcriptional regulator YdeE
MKSEVVDLGGFYLVGMTVRTNNTNEMDPGTSKIAALAGDYWGHQKADKILHRLTPGITYSAYAEFDSDEHGDYTYCIGEAVSSLEGQDLTDFRAIAVPASRYQKFTTPEGKMPEVVITAWQEIWQMRPEHFAGQRCYSVDFERYDERAQDPNNAVLDIYIGVK